ncbi:MAG: hypothetical protein E6J14_11780 [Chloroflexi bacterium]|nr:MAG: hypothetical protein E6J14_11780 [Chloroflexota bacterium]
MAASERKLATIVFADLVGSTALADADRDPERTRARLDRFYSTTAAEVERAGGTIEKFAGDAVMAAFGAPAALEDHAERALHAALAMRSRLDELFGDTVSVRIGVNSGEVVVGAASAGSAFVSGDAVNIAARLEQAAEPGQILVGDRTAAMAGGAFEFAESIALEVRGKPNAVRCRRLIRALSQTRPRGVGWLGRVFVGREGELDVLRRAYDDAAVTERPRMVTVVGEAGVGKTTLVRELWDWLGSLSPEPLRRTGRCRAYGQGNSYAPLAEVLREHLGLLESDSQQAALAALGQRQILGLTFGIDVSEGLHPLAARDRLQEAWIELLEEQAAQRPVVLVVEDIHWAGGPLLDLLDRIFDDVRGPLLLVCTCRPELLERGGPWVATALRLEPLDSKAAATLVDRLLDADAPNWVRELVIDRGEGNPFFVEELLRALIDEGRLARADEGWIESGDQRGFVVPDSVQTLLASRIDLLGPDEKEALQAASVIGRAFWSGPVYELLEEGQPNLRVLEERDFIRRQPGSRVGGEREYTFKHGLIREVAYASLTASRRAQLHAGFARWMEPRAEGRDDFAALLAHHYAAAVRLEDSDLAWAGREDELPRLRAKADDCLRRAAELAITRYEIDDAIELLQRALELRSGQDAGLWRLIGRAQALKYDGVAFVDALNHALELTDDPRLRGELYSEVVFQSSIRGGMWRDAADARSRDEDWIRRALELTALESAAHVRALIARAYFTNDAVAAGEACVAAERLGDLELECHAWAAREESAFAVGQYEEALEWARHCHDNIARISDPDHRHDILEDLIQCLEAVGQLAQARPLVAECEQICMTLSAHHRLHGAAMWLELEDLCAGWPAIVQRRPVTEAAVRANQATPCVRNARSLLLTALGCGHAGDLASAATLEAEADAFGARGFGLTLDGPRIRLALVHGDLARVERLLAESAHLPRSGWNSLSGTIACLDGFAALRDRAGVEGEAARHLRSGTLLEPFAQRALGLVRDDGSLIEQAFARFEAMGLAWYAAETRRLAGVRE